MEVLPLPASCQRRFRTSERPGWPVGDHVPLANRTDAELRNVFAVLRHPRSRVVSGFHFLDGYRHLNATTEEICAFTQARHEAHVSLGAQVKYVTGQADAHWDNNYVIAPEYLGEPSEDLVEEACARVHQFAFVGLNEHYNATLCLFHAMFGGPLHPIEYHQVRKGEYGGKGRFREVDCGDTADAQLYSCRHPQQSTTH
ncbi:hypothetical protein N2152v2_002546 [Parachlorella kessleri]